MGEDRLECEFGRLLEVYEVGCERVAEAFRVEAVLVKVEEMYGCLLRNNLLRKKCSMDTAKLGVISVDYD